MKAAERIKQKFGKHMDQSMGATAEVAPAHAPAVALPDDSAKLAGIGRLKDSFTIPISRLAPDPDQPRKEFDEEAIDRLAASLRDRGLLQPIRVRWDESRSRWIIVAGERRYRAAQRAGLTVMACVEATGELTTERIIEEQLVENCLREDLKPVEQARAFRTLMERRGCSMGRLAEMLHLSQSQVSRTMQLLNLPESIQEKVDIGTIPATIAQELARIDDPEEQRELAAKAERGDLTRTAARDRVARIRRTTRGKWIVGDATVSITIDRPGATTAEMIAALDRAKAIILGDASQDAA
jgi:ParB family chromosome partitioning protein